MALGQGILSGKKTYVLAAVGVLTAIASYLVGDVNLALTLKAVSSVTIPLMGATLRMAVSNLQS